MHHSFTSLRFNTMKLMEHVIFSLILVGNSTNFADKEISQARASDCSHSFGFESN